MTVTVVIVVVVSGAGVVGIIHVVATKYGGGVAATGGGAASTGAAAVAQGVSPALASILAIRACDLYMIPRKLSQSSLECRAGVS